MTARSTAAVPKRRIWPWVVAVGLFFFPVYDIGQRVVAEFVIGPLQDTCSFGPVSNARYRELLAEAKRRQDTVWPPFYFELNRNTASSTVLEQRFADLTLGITSVHERLAAAHAMMRAFRAVYLTSYPDAPSPIDNFNRALLLNYVKSHPPSALVFYPRDQFSVRFWVKESNWPEVGDRSNNFSFHYSRPNLLKDTGEQPRSTNNPWCPPVPSEAWAEKFLKSLQATTIR